MTNLKFDNFNFNVDEQAFCIPNKAMEDVRLIVVDAEGGSIRHDMFSNLNEYLRDDDEIVMNNVGISRSRLSGVTDSGDQVDICFLVHDPADSSSWEVVILSESYPPESGRFTLADGAVIGELKGKVAPFDGAYWLERNRYQGYRGRIKINLDQAGLRAVLNARGLYMHPWYTDINELPEDILNPSTTTLGGGALLSEPSRRMTPELLSACTDNGKRMTEVSIELAFAWRPADANDNLDNYSMNPEHIRVSAEAAQRINKAVSENRRLITVGTGPTRVLESLPMPVGSVDTHTDIFISPGYDFKYSGGLLTNLHVPMSTHVIMASAFGGRELIMQACREAADRGYHFGIHGDSMLIFNAQTPQAYQ